MQHLEKTLMGAAGRIGQQLPSVRSLAAHHGVSPLTLHRVLRRMAQNGHVHAIARKGYFWGPRPLARPPLSAPTKARLEDVRDRLLEDLRRGAFHPHRPLPDPSSLGEVYGIGAKRMAGLLSALVSQGWLARRGRRLHPSLSNPRPSHATLVVVSRCDSHGMLLIDSERETDFLKTIRTQAQELGLNPVFTGWYEEGKTGKLMDRNGREQKLESFQEPILGMIVSTWLVQDPATLLRYLRRAQAPISVWWEHPAKEFPRTRIGSMVGFNLSFGASAGWEVGRYLRSIANGSIAFISPFHASEWSCARLEGIRTALEGSGVEVIPHVDVEWESAWHIRQARGGFEECETVLESILSGFILSESLADQPIWVAVNDHVAQHLIALHRKHGLKRPWIVSFDNTSGSESWQFDSFEFHTDGMVRQMLQHLLHPGAKLFRDGGLHEMVGRMVVREPR